LSTILTSLVASFLLVAVAELGDKTQIAVITLSSRFKALSVFLGAMLAFLLVTGIAVAIGSALTRVLPAFWIRITAGDGHFSDFRSLHDFLKKGGGTSQDKGFSKRGRLFFFINYADGVGRQDPVCCMHECLYVGALFVWTSGNEPL
jgi:hypothetical protein